MTLAPLAALAAASTLGAPQHPALVLDGPAFPAPGAKGAVELRDGTVLATRTERRGDMTVVVCSASADGGRTWVERGLAASTPDPDADLGDGCLLAYSPRRLLYSYRDNRHGTAPTFSIRVRQSADGGKTWTAHSTVDTAEGEWRGLWSSYLLRTRSGALQCYYDDERTPYEAGLRRHQWLTMRQWDGRGRKWGPPITVSRAHDPRHLSRDGMPAVIDQGRGRLLCVLESVQTEPPHAGVVRCVTSEDGGRTWSWARRERQVVYEPADRRYASYAPWLAELPGGGLLCVFATNEGRPQPDVPGTPPHGLNLDVKYVSSADGGRRWHAPPVTVYDEGHKAYMPGVTALRHPRHAGAVLFLFLDTRAGFRGAAARPRGQAATSG